MRRIAAAEEGPAVPDGGTPRGGPPGADGGIRRPGRRTRLAALCGAALLVAVLALAPFARRIAASPALAIRTVSVHGAERAAPAELEALAAIEAGSPWLTLDTASAARRVESHPWIRHARVLRPWPGRVRISVDECVPVARLEIASRVYGLCEDLRVVPGAADTLPLLKARGRERTDPDALHRGLAWLSALERAGVAGREPVVLELAGAEGDHLSLPDRGFTAAVGAGVPVKLAARDIAALLETLDSEGGSRGTLRLVSAGTGVWKSAGGRAARAG